MHGSIIKNAAEFEGTHRFLSEELLQPNSNKNDSGRTTMFCSHISQTVVLDEPELPRVYSRFENAFGRYTTAIRKLPADAEVIGVFDKNPLQRVYALRYADGRAGIHFAAPVRHLTENYGYRLDNTHLDGAEVGTVLPSGKIIQGWPCHDEHGNFQYGVNLKTVYMNLDGQTYEDGIVISESAAERLSHTSIEKITVVLNANDLCVNLYGDDEVHRGFPEIGSQIQNGVLLVRRRINHESILFDLSTPQLSKINWDADTVFYSEGTVVDIDVYSNLSEVELDKNPFNAQILGHHRHWLAFREWFTATFGPHLSGEVPGGYHGDVGYWARVVRMSENKWRYERTEFDGVVMRFTIAKKNPIGIGSKLTNRMGGKGVVSQIRPDSQMPTTESGRSADMVVNSLGVNNRMNWSQLYESELNFIADHVAFQMYDLVHASGNTREGWEHMLRFLDIVSPDQGRWMRENVTSESQIEEIVREIITDRESIRIHQAPFVGNADLSTMARAYVEFGVVREKFVGIEEPMVLGTNYYMKLRHEPAGKLSARSAKHLSIKNVPTKNSRGVRMGTEHHSTTPIRLGEQELQNLLIANSPDELKRLLRIYASDDQSREGAIAELLTREDPFSTERVEAQGSGITRPTAGLMALLESIGLELVFDNETREENHEQEIPDPDNA